MNNNPPYSNNQQQQPPPRPFPHPQPTPSLQRPPFPTSQQPQNASSPQMTRPQHFPRPNLPPGVHPGNPPPPPQPTQQQFRPPGPGTSPQMMRPGLSPNMRPPVRPAPHMASPPIRGPPVPGRPPWQGAPLSQNASPVMPRPDGIARPPGQYMPPGQSPRPTSATEPPPGFQGLPPRPTDPSGGRPGPDFRPPMGGMVPSVAHQPTPSSGQWNGPGPASGPVPPAMMPGHAPGTVDQMANQLGGMSIGQPGASQSPQQVPHHRAGRAQRVYNAGGQSPVASDQQMPSPYPGQSIPPSSGQSPNMPPHPQQQFGQPIQPYGRDPAAPSHPASPNSGYPQTEFNAASHIPVGPSMMNTQPIVFPSPTPPRQQQMNMFGAAHGGQPRSRIDPNQIPSPVLVQEHDQELFEGQPYITTSKQMPPLASSDFRAIDEGNCNPRFMRLTTYSIPHTEDMLNHSELPLGMIIQPLAELKPGEQPIQVVDFNEEGPVRCNRCRAYINPFVQFTDGGRRFVCNLCSFDNEVPQSYFANIDMNGRRMDAEGRPELRCGTVEFAVSKEYWAREPTPLCYMFAVDVCRNAVQTGMLRATVASIRALLYGEGTPGLLPGTKVAITTFDKSIYFYNLQSDLDQAQMLVVSDILDVFVPINNGFFVDPTKSRTVIEGLLDTLPSMFENTVTGESASGAAVQACLAAMTKSGGKVCLFATTLPIFGPGILKSREDPLLINTEKERELYAPQEGMWKDTAVQCVEAGICVDLYLFPHAYIDVATLGVLSTLTGGDTFLYPNFEAQRDGEKLTLELKRALTREFGYNALMRVRCSNGLKIGEHFGNFYMKNNTDVELAGIDADKAIGVQIKHESKLDENGEASFQCALLYTNATGQRRVRVHNISVPITALIGNVFKYGDMDTSINYLCKLAVSQSLDTPLRNVREMLTEKCVKVLSSYRTNCASSTAPGQLILPESFKLFPVYALAMLKSRALRAGVSTDIRVHEMRMFKNMGVDSTIVLLYPKMMDLNEMTENIGFPDDMGRVRLPPLVRGSYIRLDPRKAYLLTNGQASYMWLGRQLDPEFIHALFGVTSLEEVNPNMQRLPIIDSMISTQVRNILTYLQTQHSRNSRFRITRQQMDNTEFEFTSLLAEDNNNDSMSYVDYLCHVHRQIQTEVSQSKDY